MERGRVEERAPERGRMEERAPERGRMEERAPERGRMEERAPERGRMEERAPERGRMEERARAPEPERGQGRRPGRTEPRPALTTERRALMAECLLCRSPVLPSNRAGPAQPQG